MQYRQLSFSSGLRDSIRQEAQGGCASIAIGLGGAGVSCLRALKRQVYAHRNPDDPEAAACSRFRFLAVDADHAGMKPESGISDLKVDEFFDISGGNVRKLLQQTCCPEYARLMERIPPFHVYIPCGIRRLGHLLLICRSGAFMERLCQLIREVRAGLPEDSEVRIHIFSGLGGGTGSGILLDVCYLMQKALQEMGAEEHAKTSGYLFLPDASLRIFGSAGNPALCEHILANSYAVLKELDYCKNFPVNGGSWEQAYIGFQVGPVRKPPMELCYLISAGDTQGARGDSDQVMDTMPPYFMPLWSDGVSPSVHELIQICREAYLHSSFPGTHIYEGAPGDPRDWRQLPDFTF